MIQAMTVLPFEVVSTLATLIGMAMLGLAFIPSLAKSRSALTSAAVLGCAGAYCALSTVAHLALT